MRFTRFQYRLAGYVSRLNTILIRREFSSMGRSTVWWNAKIDNPGYISIGDGVAVRSGSWIYAVVSDQAGNRFNPSVEIGDRVYLGHRLHLTAINRVTIEDDVMIADGVYISDNFHDYRDITRPVQKQQVFSKGPVLIRRGAFIGEGARIVGPVTVGKNSVVGSNSVVTRDVPDYSVAVGIPARIIRRYDESSGRWLESTQIEHQKKEE